jgi:hypothetical protein
MNDLERKLLGHLHPHKVRLDHIALTIGVGEGHINH